MPKAKTSKSVVDQLIDQNLLLQKKNVDLLTSMNKLTKKVDRLLNVFEEASKHVMEAGDERRILEIGDKLSGLLDQNRNIAKGLLTLEEYIKNKAPLETK